MNDVPPVASTAPSEPLEESSRHPAGSGERQTRQRHKEKKRRTPDWWRQRNVLGVRNWELALIVVVALLAGVVATIGSSIVGVR